MSPIGVASPHLGRSRRVGAYALGCLAMAVAACGAGGHAALSDGADGVTSMADSGGPGLGHPIQPPRDAGADHTMAHHHPDASVQEGLHVNGTSILDGTGQPIRLHGVNRAGSEYACVQGFGVFDGPVDAPSIDAMKSWNINAVRIPMNEDCWLSINGAPAAFSGSAYQSGIVDYVNLLLQNGIYPILDLHWSAPGTILPTGVQQPMPDSDHSVAFWTSVASTFMSNPNVIFELYNEPWPDNNQDTDAAWDCWQNGGGEDGDGDGGVDAGPCTNVGFAVAGMQTLVTAVRNTGAPNLLLLGGVEYSNALTEWAAHVPTDPLGNLAAAWHVYAGEACSDGDCWNGTDGGTGAPLSVAQAFPIVATEIGDNGCDPTFPVSVMTWLDGEGQSYLGWAWNAYDGGCANYALISDYSGTPTDSYGTAFQTQFLAQ